jgi:hypothetical protein
MKRCVNFVNSPYGVIEFRICEILGKTPKEIGEIRRKDPKQIRFFELYIDEMARRREEEANKNKYKGKLKGK